MSHCDTCGLKSCWDQNGPCLETKAAAAKVVSKNMAKQAHYEQLSPQPIDVIRAWKLGFHLGNVIKYVGRCTTKGQELEDLEKAKVYLQWRIDELKEEEKRRKMVRIAQVNEDLSKKRFLWPYDFGY